MFKTFLLLFGLTIFFIFIGRLIAGRKGMIVAFVIALLMNGFSYWFSDTIVLKAYGAKPAPEGHRLVALTKEIADKAGIPMPKVYILPTASPNAFATGRNPEHAAVAATEGIMGLMDERELMGVIAHEIGHVKNRDTLVQTMAASIAGGVMLLSRMALYFGGDSKQGFAKTLAVSILAPIAATIITMAISREREYMADEFSARITQRPEYLASALEKLERGVARNPMKPHSPETAHMFIVNPFAGSSFRELFSTHPPIQKRIQKLTELQGKIR